MEFDDDIPEGFELEVAAKAIAEEKARQERNKNLKTNKIKEARRQLKKMNRPVPEETRITALYNNKKGLAVLKKESKQEIERYKILRERKEARGAYDMVVKLGGLLDKGVASMEKLTMDDIQGLDRTIPYLDAVHTMANIAQKIYPKTIGSQDDPRTTATFNTTFLSGLQPNRDQAEIRSSKTTIDIDPG